MNMPKVELTLDLPNYSAYAESKRIFIPVADKKAKDEKSMIPVRVRRIMLTCKRSGAEIKFPATERNGQTTFGDSRPTANRLPDRRNIREMRTELARMLGEDAADRLINIATY